MQIPSTPPGSVQPASRLSSRNQSVRHMRLHIRSKTMLHTKLWRSVDTVPSARQDCAQELPWGTTFGTVSHVLICPRAHLRVKLQRLGLSLYRKIGVVIGKEQSHFTALSSRERAHGIGAEYKADGAGCYD
ncbi:hypothetical protein WMY93_006969 [Mugilogobius chulae]|uniref:Uncharacterized protein n=1 Tax=Mugilogobius chulae TaxID=88201 RepID=A0AAW0PVR9_9GOBI